MPVSQVVRSPCRALTMTPRSSEVHARPQPTHGDLAQNRAVTACDLRNLGQDDLVLTCVPLCERFGLTCGLLATVGTGVTLAMLPKFDAAKALKMIASERVTVFEGTPAMSRRCSGRPTGMTWISGHCGCAFRARRCRPICGADSQDRFDSTVLDRDAGISAGATGRVEDDGYSYVLDHKKT